MTEFIAVANSTMLDVCLNTYGSLNRMVKLMVDNNIPNVNYRPYAGQVFLFDENLVVTQTNQSLNQNYNVLNTVSKTKYATA